jgi:hypothetical protein
VHEQCPSRILFTIGHPSVLNDGDVIFDIAMELKAVTNEEEVLERYGLTKKKFILATIHRSKDTDAKGTLQILFMVFAISST